MSDETNTVEQAETNVPTVTEETSRETRVVETGDVTSTVATENVSRSTSDVPQE